MKTWTRTNKNKKKQNTYQKQLRLDAFAYYKEERTSVAFPPYGRPISSRRFVNNLTAQPGSTHPAGVRCGRSRRNFCFLLQWPWTMIHGDTMRCQRFHFFFFRERQGSRAVTRSIPCHLSFIRSLMAECERQVGTNPKAAVQCMLLLGS